MLAAIIEASPVWARDRAVERREKNAIARLGAAGQMRHKEERQQHANQNGETQKPREQPVFIQSGRRSEQEVQRKSERYGADQHERMAAAPARLQPVGHLTDHGVCDRVNDQRQQLGHAREAAQYAKYLVVIEKQKYAEGRVLDAGTDLADAISQFDRCPPKIESARYDSNFLLVGRLRYTAGTRVAVACATTT